MTKQNQNRSDSEINAAITQYEQASTLLARGRNEQALDLFLQLIDQASWLIPSYSGAGAASLEIGRFHLITEGLRVVEQGHPTATMTSSKN